MIKAKGLAHYIFRMFTERKTKTPLLDSLDNLYILGMDFDAASLICRAWI